MKFSSWLKESVKLVKEVEEGGKGVDASDDIRYSSENLVSDIKDRRIKFVATKEDVLEVLDEGVPAFNEWRDINKVDRLDLKYFDLSNRDLSGINLSNCSLAYANLSGTNLTGANLTNTFLFGANLKGAILDKGKKKAAKSQRLDDIEKELYGIDISKLDQDLDYDDYLMFFKEFNEKSRAKIVAVKGALESSLEVPLRAVAKLSDGRFIKISSRVNDDEELVILTLVDKTGSVIKKVKFDMMYEHFADVLLKLTK